MTRRRVAITGMSVVSSLGENLQANLIALKNSQSGIAPITRFDASAFKTKIAGEVKNLQFDSFIDPKDARTMDLFIQFAMVAAREALFQSGLVTSSKLQLEGELRQKAGSIIGCGLGGLPELEDGAKVVAAKGPTRMSPFFIPKLISNLAPGHIAMTYGLEGPNYAVTSACASGAHAIGEAYRLIQFGVQDVMVTGGTESTISPLCIGGFNAMRALSTRNEEPTKASRPYDKDRDGFVCGEGSGILILEEWEHAKARGAHIYAEIVGYGATCDAHHMTAPAPGGAGAVRAMKTALADASANPTAVGAINAHGTSTGLGDIAETEAIKTTFGDHAKKLKVTSTKSMTGHTLGAAGGIEAIYTALGLYHQLAFPTINLDQPDPQCDLDYVPHHAQDLKHELALTNSFGFGGTNVSLLLRRV